MPSSTVKQAKVMSAIAHGWHPSEGSVAKIPVKVAKDFHAADAGHKYGKGMHKGDKTKKALHTARKYSKKAEGGKVKKNPFIHPTEGFRHSPNVEDRRDEWMDKFHDTTYFPPKPGPSFNPGETIGQMPDALGAASLDQQLAGFADGGEVDDDKQQAIDIHPVDPNEGLAGDLMKRTPLEGKPPTGAGFSSNMPTEASTYHPTIGERVGNFLKGPDTPFYAPRADLVNKAEQLNEFTPWMQAKEAGQDVAKGDYQDAAMFMVPGAKKGKKALMALDDAMELAAKNAMGTHPENEAIYNSLKKPFPKDLAQQVFYKGYTPDEVSNIHSYLLPGAQPNFTNNYNKLYGKKAQVAPEVPSLPPEHPDFIQNYHTAQGIDYNKVLANIEAAIDKVPSSKPPGPFEVPMENYDKLHDKLSQQPLGLNQDQKGAVSYWGDPAGYKVLQGHLRGTYSSPEGFETISNLDSAMAPLAEPTSVWRGLHGPHAEELKKLGEGDSFWNAGYTATSIDPRRATHYGAKDGPGIILNYHLPEGHPALYTSHPDAGGWSQAEREMLLPHGAPFKIIGTEKIQAPVWDYTGNVTNAKPQDFVVYHVAPTDEVYGAHQLDMTPGAKFLNSGPKPVTGGFKSKGKDTDIEDYYAHQEKHEQKDWEPEDDWEGKPHSNWEHEHDPVIIHETAPFLKWKQGALSKTAYMQEMRSHIKPSNWMDYRPKDVKPEELPPINWGINDPAYLRSIGVNTDTHLFKGGEWNTWGDAGPDPFVPGGYPKVLMDPNIKHAEQSFHMASKPGIAESYHGSKNMGGSYVAWKPKFAEFDWPSFFGSNHYSDGDLDGITKQAKKMGLDMVAVHNMHDIGSAYHGLHTQYLVLNTNVLRAPHAAFDPQKWHLRYPLAGIAGTAAGAGIYSYGDEDNHFAHGGRVEAEKALPANHQLGMKVPKGGSMCANCKFLASPTTCGNKGFIEWNGKPELPAPSDQYCCDLYGHDKPEHKAEGGGTRFKDFRQSDNIEDRRKEHFRSFPQAPQYPNVFDDGTMSGLSWQSDFAPTPANNELSNAAGANQLDDKVEQYLAARQAKGGKVAKKEEDPKDHEFINFAKGGLINSDIPGRTDKIPMKVPPGSYVLPADIPSALGQGNTSAGSEILSKMFTHSAYGLKPMTQKGSRFTYPSFPTIGHSIGKAEGGRTNSEHVPIIAAGGEYIIHPDVVKAVGHGDISKGHEVLDRFVLRTRKEHIKTLKGLKGPKQ